MHKTTFFSFNTIIKVYVRFIDFYLFLNGINTLLNSHSKKKGDQIGLVQGIY